MNRRFSLRLVVMLFLSAAVVLAWIASNLRKAQIERDFVASAKSNEYNDGRSFRIELLTEKGPSSEVWAVLLSAVGAQRLDVWVYIENVGGEMRATEQDFDRAFAVLSRQLDSMNSIHVSGLTVVAATVPSSVRNAAWARNVTSIRAVGAMLRELPLERMAAIKSLDLVNCEFNGSDFDRAELLNLEDVSIAGSQWMDSEALAIVSRSPRLKRLEVTGAGPRRSRNATEVRGDVFLWSDSDLKSVANAANIESLRLDSLKIDDGGFAELDRCSHLQEVALYDVEVTTTLDPLLRHPSLKEIYIDGDLLETRPPAMSEVSRSLTWLHLYGSTVTIQFDSQIKRLVNAQFSYDGGDVVENVRSR